MQIGWVDHISILPSVSAIRMLNASKLGTSRLISVSLVSFPPSRDYHCPFSTSLQDQSQVFFIHSHNAESRNTDGHAQAQFMGLA